MHAFLTMSMSRINFDKANGDAGAGAIDDFTFGPPSPAASEPGEPIRPPAYLTADPEQDADDEPAAGVGGLHVTPHEFDIARHDAIVTLISPRTGDHRTFRVRTIRDGELAGARVVELLTGSDNTSDYQGFAFVSDGRHGKSCLAGTVCVWRRFQAERNEAPSIYERYADLLNRAEYWSQRGVEFRLALNCRRCGRLLTHRESLADGYGPICRQKAMGA